MDNVGAELEIVGYLEELAAWEEVMCNKGDDELLVIVYARPRLERCVDCGERVDLP
jgi:hypothetical protein